MCGFVIYGLITRHVSITAPLNIDPAIVSASHLDMGNVDFSVKLYRHINNIINKHFNNINNNNNDDESPLYVVVFTVNTLKFK